jgi:hypothetical protein
MESMAAQSDAYSALYTIPLLVYVHVDAGPVSFPVQHCQTENRFKGVK